MIRLCSEFIGILARKLRLCNNSVISSQAKGMGMGSISAKRVASYFIEKSSKLDEDNDLTNLKLQKILYFAQVESIKKNGAKLFRDEIEAWQYGPVVREVYDWLKGCGAYTITSFDVPLDVNGMTDEAREFLDFIWKKYNKYSASHLVRKSHASRSAWSIVYKNGQGNREVIPYERLRTTATL